MEEKNQNDINEKSQVLSRVKGEMLQKINDLFGNMGDDVKENVKTCIKRILEESEDILAENKCGGRTADYVLKFLEENLQSLHELEKTFQEKGENAILVYNGNIDRYREDVISAPDNDEAKYRLNVLKSRSKYNNEEMNKNIKKDDEYTLEYFNTKNSDLKSALRKKLKMRGIQNEDMLSKIDSCIKNKINSMYENHKGITKVTEEQLDVICDEEIDEVTKSFRGIEERSKEEKSNENQSKNNDFFHELKGSTKPPEEVAEFDNASAFKKDVEIKSKSLNAELFK